MYARSDTLTLIPNNTCQAVPTCRSVCLVPSNVVDQKEISKTNRCASNPGSPSSPYLISFVQKGLVRVKL